MLLALVAAVVAAVIFLLGGVRAIDDTADVAWAYVGWFFVALALIFALIEDRLPWRRQ